MKPIIEKGIPINASVGRKPLHPEVTQVKVGQCVTTDADGYEAIRQAAVRHGMRTGKKFKTGQDREEPTKWRIWRVA